MPTWAELAGQFLTTTPHAELWHPSLEVQIMPADENDPEYLRYAEPGAEPRPKRLLIGYSSEPMHQDGPIPYDPNLIKLIGPTGWNSVDHQTEFIGLDFDQHDGGRSVDLTAEQIAQVDQWAAAIPYVAASTSKSGLGRRWIVRLAEPIPSATPDDHRRVADAIMAKLSADLGFDLRPYVCTYGGPMFLWARRPKPGGLQLIKAAVEPLKLPDDWQTLAKPKLRNGMTDAQKRELDTELASNNVQLDAAHRSIIATLESAGYHTEVIEQGGKTIIRLHTAGLAIDHARNKRKGPFATNSAGNNPSEPNAYAFLLPHGGLAVYRYGNAPEADCWKTSAAGTRYIHYNVPLTFDATCDMCGGVFSAPGEYAFKCEIEELMRHLGIDFTMPNELKGKNTTVKKKGEQLTVSVPGTPDERDRWTLDGWKYDRRKWTHYVRDYEESPAAVSMPKSDDHIRFTVSNKKGEGWHFKDAKGEYVGVGLDAIKTWLRGQGFGKEQVEATCAYHQSYNWELVNIPFAGETPGNRVWNRDGAQFAFEPEKGPCDYWYKVLAHCGRGLDDAVFNDPWCRRQNIMTGGDYLLWYVAKMFQDPRQRLPYLFIFGPQNVGKSTLPRACRMLMRDRRGAPDLSRVLRKDDFNHKMFGAVLCELTEVDLSTNPQIRNTVKALIESDLLDIRGMYDRNSGDHDNYTHWIHTSNYLHYCPILEGDTRIVVIQAVPFDGEEIPTAEMVSLLRAEAPAFLHRILNMRLPKRGDGRLYLPVLNTPAKEAAIAELRSLKDDWYLYLSELGAEGEIKRLTAKAIHEKIGNLTSDPRFPKNHRGLASALLAKQQQLKADGLELISTPGKPTTYTIQAK